MMVSLSLPTAASFSFCMREVPPGSSLLWQKMPTGCLSYETCTTLSFLARRSGLYLSPSCQVSPGKCLPPRGGILARRLDTDIPDGREESVSRGFSEVYR
jgi:hypothetical protein